MPLITPVEVLPAEQLGAVHFIAIGGAGMSGIAQLFLDRGLAVSGSDQADSPALDQLCERGASVFVGHAAEQLGAAETVVVSSAIRESNVELARARSLGLRIYHRSAALASLMIGHRGVAVTGTHGKTTTSAMIAHALTVAGADPSYVIGSPLALTGSSAHTGRGPAFVVEADESDGSFRQYPAQVVVVTNIEADHLDNWITEEAYAEGFVELASASQVELVVLSADDPGTVALARRLASKAVKVVTFGTEPAADVRLIDLEFEGTTATARLVAGDFSGPLRLSVPGRYNLLNAAAAFVVGRELGIGAAELLAAAATFGGTHRRFEHTATAAGVRIYDDYAHHPTEVSATLAAARTAAGKGRVVACFQPHLFTRTRDLSAEFGAALALADRIVVLDIYPAREDPIPGITGRLVADAATALAGSDQVSYIADKDNGAEALADIVRPGDLVLTIGAGDVHLLGPALARLLQLRMPRAGARAD